MTPDIDLIDLEYAADACGQLVKASKAVVDAEHELRTKRQRLTYLVGHAARLMSKEQIARITGGAEQAREV